MKFGIFLYKRFFKDSELRENRLTDIHSLLNGVEETLILISILLDRRN
jgi:hypothetical protein